MPDEDDLTGQLPAPIDPTEMWSGEELDVQLKRRLADRARAGELKLTGPGSVLQLLAKQLLEAALAVRVMRRR